MPLRVAIRDTSSIDDHAKLIRQQVEASLRDPDTRRLAAALVSGSYDWVTDPRGNRRVPVVPFHGRYYRVSADGRAPKACHNRDFTCEIVAIWNFLVLNVRYTADADGYDAYQDLRTTLESASADCDDFTIAFCALLRSVGFECAARIISQDGRSWAHIYPLVHHPGQNGWIALDATEDNKKPGWEFPNARAVVDFPMGEG